MEAPSSSDGSKARRNRTPVPKPLWADMVDPSREKKQVEKEKEKNAKEEPMEEEWWEKDWKDSRKTWNDWWQEKEDEWSDWKTWEKEEEEAAAAKAREDQKQPAKTKKEEPEEERNVLRGPEARWKNRTGSSKQKSKLRWAENKALEEGEDPEMVKLGAMGASRMKMLVSRQEDRMSHKETVAAAERAAKDAAQAAQSAKDTAQLWAWQSWQWQQAYWGQGQVCTTFLGMAESALV